jgi:hypothetical protein
MPVISGFPGFRFMQNAAVRTGLCTGVGLTLVFATWVLTANRVPFLEPWGMERNIVAIALLVFFACIPVMRFYHSPSELLSSGLLGWAILTLTYWVFSVLFSLLEEFYSVVHVLALGIVSYLVFATLSWIGTMIWRARATSSHLHH